MSIQSMDQLLPPEGVPLHFRIAGVGVRLAAQLSDLMITCIAALALFLFVMAIDLTTPGTLIAIASMLFFFIRIPYYAMSELIWNGQTIGKRLLKIKVVAADGRALTTQSLVIRNLMKEAEIFLPGTLLLTLDATRLVPSLLSLFWVMCVVAVPLFNKRRKRLGDIIAGTYVVHLPQPVLLKDMAKAIKQPLHSDQKFRFLTHHLEHYGAFELQTLEGFLRSSDRNKGPAAYQRHKTTLDALVDQIRRKIDYADSVRAEDQLAFLEAFYKAQRGYLEQRQLFGDKRVDKHHGTQDDPP